MSGSPNDSSALQSWFADASLKASLVAAAATGLASWYAFGPDSMQAAKYAGLAGVSIYAYMNSSLLSSNNKWMSYAAMSTPLALAVYEGHDTNSLVMFGGVMFAGELGAQYLVTM